MAFRIVLVVLIYLPECNVTKWFSALIISAAKVASTGGAMVLTGNDQRNAGKRTHAKICGQLGGVLDF